MPVAEQRLESFNRAAFVVAAVTFAVLVSYATRYGWHRDELYFLQCARHLAGGYVDQPVFTPLVARVSLTLFGRSLLALRTFPAIASGGTVVLCALLAREFGGGRGAQLLAAIGAATAPAVLGSGHLHGPTAYDITAWSALAFLVARLVRTGDRRLWVAAGAVTGLGLANKHSIGFFVLALLVGLVATGHGELLRSRWFLLGAVIAVAFTVPDLVWQAGHQWATIAMTRRLNQKYGGLAAFALFVPAQLVMASPALVGMWFAGLRRLWRPDAADAAFGGVGGWRTFALSYTLLFLFFGLTGGKHVYYVAAMYVVLLAAGAVVVAGRVAGRLAELRRLFIALGVATVVAVPAVLPVLPPSTTGWTATVNPVMVETVGWPELVHTVSDVWYSLPASERAHAVIFTADYGEAGAINELGGGDHLPRAVSGQNNFWWWGPGDPTATTVVAVAPGPKDTHDYDAYLRTFFGDVATAARLTNRAGLANEEAGGHVYICRRPRQPWGRMWPRLRHYD
ncbi:MAG: glycosyltransferase family 39 protein [Acidimicrobiia bacterium]|nr:glycosyltransferase family 39 protein [Acidimicrobiia bacterium]